MTEQQSERPGLEPDWQAIHADLQAHVESVYPTVTYDEFATENLAPEVQGVSRETLQYLTSDTYLEDQYYDYMNELAAEAERRDEIEDLLAEDVQTYGDSAEI